MNNKTETEDVYFLFEYFVADGLAHLISTQRRWRVQTIQFFTGANPGVVRVFPVTGGSAGAFGVVNVAANGCITLTPAGEYRQHIEVSGNGARVIIEYTFQVRPDPNLTTLPTVTPP